MTLATEIKHAQPALVFDLGGVLMRHSEQMKAYFRAKESEEIRALSAQLGIGAIKVDEFLAKTGYTCDEWNSLHAGIDEKTIEWLKDLGTRYPLYLLSNNDEMRWRHVLDTCPGFDGLFRVCVVSQQVQVAKPDERIYAIMEDRIQADLGYMPPIVFTDDSAENRLVAEKRGWHTFDSLHALISGILIPDL